MVRRTFFAGIALASFQIPSAFAQPPHSTPEEPCADCVTIPALTPIKIELLETLGSKVSTSGETFPFRLAGPVLIDGKVAIPAGTPGVGEVVHAKKSGGSGAAGELVLAARYLDVQGRRLRLRSMNFAVNGHSNIRTVNSVAIASAAAAPPAALIGFLITGSQITVPQGTLADAKTAEAFTVSPSAAVPATIKAADQPTGEAIQ